MFGWEPTVDSPGDQSAGAYDAGGGLMAAPAPANGAHIGFAAIILLVILLKAFTESNLITTDLAEVKVSLLNLFSVFLMAKAGDIGFAWLTAWMAKNGLALPGQVELAKV